MKIALLCIGDELVTGQVINRNSAFIASSLLDHGLRVSSHTVTGDLEEEIVNAVNFLAAGNDIVIATGGVGPTFDDVTSAAVAKATGNPLEENRHALAHIRETVAKRNLLYSTSAGDKQAFLPAGSTIIRNPLGTASGFHMLHHGCRLFFLPGVPVEMKLMLQESVIPCIKEICGGKNAIRIARFNIFGLSEPETDKMLSGMADHEKGLFLGICVIFPWIRITLRAESGSEEEADTLLLQASEKVREQLGGWIFSEGEIRMEEKIAELFTRSGLTLSLAESCTGGMLAERLTSVPGSSAWFLEGGVTYSNEAKIRQLGVPEETLEKYGAVSREVAEAMAVGARVRSMSDLSLAVTGIAGPSGGSADKPVGTVFISLADSRGCWTERFSFNGSRENIRVMTTWRGMDWLRRYLSNQNA